VKEVLQDRSPYQNIGPKKSRVYILVWEVAGLVLGILQGIYITLHSAPSETPVYP